MAVFSQGISRWVLQSFPILHNFAKKLNFTPWVRTRLWLWVFRKVWVPLCLKHTTFGCFFNIFSSFYFYVFYYSIAFLYCLHFFPAKKTNLWALFCFLAFLTRTPHRCTRTHTCAHPNAVCPKLKDTTHRFKGRPLPLALDIPIFLFFHWPKNVVVQKRSQLFLSKHQDNGLVCATETICILSTFFYLFSFRGWFRILPAFTFVLS